MTETLFGIWFAVLILMVNLFEPVWLFHPNAAFAGMGKIQAIAICTALVLCGWFYCPTRTRKQKVVALLVAYVAATTLTNLIGHVIR